MEGETEELYFDQFKAKNVKIQVQRGKGTDPKSLVTAADNLIEEFKKEGSLRRGDQVWIVLDQDDSTPEQLEKIFDWQQVRANQADRGVGLSIPQFEYWLLLHYEDGHRVGTQRECLDKLKAHDPNFDKADKQSVRFERSDIEEAVRRARTKTPQVPSSYQELVNQGLAGATTVYPLVDKLLESTAA